MNNGIFMRPAKDGGFIVSSSDIMQSIGGGFGMPEPLFAGELGPCLEYLERTFAPKAEVAEPVISEWIEHVCSWQPPRTDNQYVEAELRNGNKVSKPAESLNWTQYGNPADVVRYRILPHPLGGKNG